MFWYSWEKETLYNSKTKLDTKLKNVIRIKSGSLNGEYLSAVWHCLINNQLASQGLIV